MPPFARVIVVLLLALGCPRLSEAADLALAWDPPEEGVPTGYRLYYGTASRSYSVEVDVGNTTLYTVRNLSYFTTYYFAVRAYDATGALSDPSNELSATPAVPVVTSLSLISSVPSPQVIGSTVNWVATATGGVPPYQFEWALYAAGSWTTVQPWSTSATWTWIPSAAGDYQVRVAARSAGSTSETGELTQSVPFTVTAPPVASVTLTADLASPQPVGSRVRWSAFATGGVAPYQYKWWVFDGSVWTVKTDWRKRSTWSWTPTVANDEYVVQVWVRRAGQTGNVPEASASVPFPIKPK